MKMLLLLLCGLFSVAVISSDSLHAQSLGDPPPITPDAPSIISSTYSQSTVFLAIFGVTQQGVSENKTGTGAVISSDGYIITAAHNLRRDSKDQEPFAKLAVRGSLGVNFDPSFATGTVFPIEVIKSDLQTDVALLKMPPVQKFTPVRFCRVPHTKEGQRIHALSFPLGGALSVNSGNLSSKNQTRGLWKTDVLVSEGSSGGPVFDDTGHVIALVRGGLSEVAGNNFITPSNLFQDLIQSGLGMFDDCVGSEPTLRDHKDCAPRLVSYNIDIVKSDHNGLAPDSRDYVQQYAVQPGWTIESATWASGSINNSETPRIDIALDKRSVTITTSVRSGPIFDQWRGWVSGQVITTQKPKCD